MLVTLVDRSDPQHEVCSRTLAQQHKPYLIPEGLLGELFYMLAARFNPMVVDHVLNDMKNGIYELESIASDLDRIHKLIQRYNDLPLGFTDACVVACAERNGGKVLTLDRDFYVVAGEGKIEVLPS